MPKSKRARLVHLTKTSKKPKSHKETILSALRRDIDEFQYIYVFSVVNMRNQHLKALRSHFTDSRIIFSKTKLLALALGRDAASAPFPGTFLLTPYLKGEVGLLLSPHPPKSVISYISTYHPTSYARPGIFPSITVSIQPGPISYGQEFSDGGGERTPLPPAVEPTLRQLGVPTRLVKGTVVLEGEEPYVVCEKDKKLEPRQTAILRTIGVEASVFKVGIEAWWEKETGAVMAFGEAEEATPVVEEAGAMES
ncbi:MAG: mRNA turnover and ribosome assembly protein [Cirrosporium novae-zelandiae]|nr:MAG: mRNA turnover and ribosome assembly protein [Cirrosporium novae-zelandiae]